MNGNPCLTIIGIGLGLQDMSMRALCKIASAQVLIGGKRQLAFFPAYKGEKIAIGKNAALLVKQLAAKLQGKNAVVLASGDPNFYGIAALFCEQFPNEQIEIIPNITAFQAAFARIKEPWDSVSFISVHGRNIKALDKIVRMPGIFVVYCDTVNTPAAVASYLIEQDSALAKCKTWACDSLGTDKEKITAGALKKMLRVKSSPLCMMIIKNEQCNHQYCPGIPDELFAHDRAMITRRDVRLMVLARLELNAGLVMWDIGAGSGSVAIEAANSCRGIQAFAIEKSVRRLAQLKINIRRFSAPNIQPVAGNAPEVFVGLPRPDRVFIGGSGGSLEAILHSMKKVLQDGAIVVVNCVTITTLETVTTWFKKLQWPYEVTSVNTSRLVSSHRPEFFRSENPVFIVQGRAQVKRG